MVERVQRRVIPLRSIAACACGHVRLALDGPHISCVACHCDDCQSAAHRMDALPSPEPTMDGVGGTQYVLHRKDRYTLQSGDGLLQPYRLRAGSPTRRMVALCCNSPMFVAFDNSQHWISVYRARIEGQAPALQSRIATRFAHHAGAVPQDVPSYRSFPISLVVQLLRCRARMALGR